ncbi:MAG: YdiU family protein [Burkholderiales bacterium]|nr:YdiU family protein [Burkholderiales bacterium]
MPILTFSFDNTYARELNGFYSEWQPEVAPQPSLLYFNRELALELGAQLHSDAPADLAQVFSGNALPAGAAPLAQAYAGHQFGGFSPQLGDGRALLLGEVVDAQGLRRDIAFKGSGRTPFSRGGDGKAAVGPMLREVIIGEAMHGLGIPSTRALAVVATGTPVFREMPLPGAVLTRVAQSHLRVGTFEFFAARQLTDETRRLADYAIARHGSAPQLEEFAGLADVSENVAGGDAQRYLAFFKGVAQRQAQLIAQWMQVGFIHGVMNTDNMTISGETIDYGPCAFMENYDPLTVFSSIDQHGRYAYGNQPAIAQWNLARLAETLLPLMGENEDQALADLGSALDQFLSDYDAAWLVGMRKKMGLRDLSSNLQLSASGEAGPGGIAGCSERADVELIQAWLDVLQTGGADFTLAWRYLADAAEGQTERLRSLFVEQAPLEAWLEKWAQRCAQEDAVLGGAQSQNEPAEQTEQPEAAGQARAERMRSVNPWLIARNHQVEAALAAASERADLAPLNRLLAALKDPFTENAEFADLARPAPKAEAACYKTYCGT